jgi:hypothetical protein
LLSVSSSNLRYGGLACHSSSFHKYNVSVPE